MYLTPAQCHTTGWLSNGQHRDRVAIDAQRVAEPYLKWMKEMLRVK